MAEPLYHLPPLKGPIVNPPQTTIPEIPLTLAPPAWLWTQQAVSPQWQPEPPEVFTNPPQATKPEFALMPMPPAWLWTQQATVPQWATEPPEMFVNPPKATVPAIRLLPPPEPWRWTADATAWKWQPRGPEVFTNPPQATKPEFALWPMPPAWLWAQAAVNLWQAELSAYEPVQGPFGSVPYLPALLPVPQNTDWQDMWTPWQTEGPGLFSNPNFTVTGIGPPPVWPVAPMPPPFAPFFVNPAWLPEAMWPADPRFWASTPAQPFEPPLVFDNPAWMPRGIAGLDTRVWQMPSPPPLLSLLKILGAAAAATPSYIPAILLAPEFWRWAQQAVAPQWQPPPPEEFVNPPPVLPWQVPMLGPPAPWRWDATWAQWIPEPSWYDAVQGPFPATWMPGELWQADPRFWATAQGHPTEPGLVFDNPAWLPRSSAVDMRAWIPRPNVVTNPLVFDNPAWLAQGVTPPSAQFWTPLPSQPGVPALVMIAPVPPSWQPGPGWIPDTTRWTPPRPTTMSGLIDAPFYVHETVHRPTIFPMPEPWRWTPWRPPVPALFVQPGPLYFKGPAWLTFTLEGVTYAVFVGETSGQPLFTQESVKD